MLKPISHTLVLLLCVCSAAAGKSGKPASTKSLGNHPSQAHFTYWFISNCSRIVAVEPAREAKALESTNTIYTRTSTELVIASVNA